MIPEISKLVGTKQQFGGGLFSGKKELEYQEYDVIKWRWSGSTIINTNTLERLHPGVELLLKNERMKRARWSRAFPARDIVPDGDEGWRQISNSI